MLQSLVCHESLCFQKTPVPWGSIFTSPAVLAIATADFAYQWLWYTALTLMPTYFNDVLKFDITTVSKNIFMKMYAVKTSAAPRGGGGGHETLAAPDVRIGGGQRRRAPKIWSKLAN